MVDQPSQSQPQPPDEPPLDAPDLAPVPLSAPPEGQAHFVDQPQIEPRTQATEPDAGTKMFVTFFFLIVPALGVIVLAAVCWMLFRKFLAA